MEAILLCKNKLDNKKNNKTFFLEEMLKKYNGEYSLISEYKGSEEEGTFIHNKCMRIFTLNKVRYLNEYSQRGTIVCPMCREEHKSELANLDFVKRVEILTNGEYLPLEKYKVGSKILMKHVKCGNEFHVSPGNFIGSEKRKGTRCPDCSKVQQAMSQTKTPEEFKKEVEIKYGKRFSITKDYVKSSEKIEVQCNICNYIREIKPFAFLHRGVCPVCDRASEFTSDIFKKKLEINAGNNYQLLSECTGLEDEITLKHNECESIFQISPASVIRRKYNCCPQCHSPGKKIKEAKVWTKNMFISEVEKLNKNRYEIIGDYINARTKILILDKKYNKEFDVQPHDFLRRGCPSPHDPRISHKRTTQEEFQKMLSDMNKSLIVIGEYTSLKDPIKIKCKKCNHEWSPFAGNILRGGNCVRCGTRKIRDTDSYKKEIEELTNNEYIVLGEFISTTLPVKMFHVTCGKEFEIQPHYFISNESRCTHCRLFKGEKRVEEWLERKSINYDLQYRIPECKQKRPLPFDFAVFKDDFLYALIEYDGEGHYQPVNWKGIDTKRAEILYKNTLKRDKIKNQFCYENDIKLIRIPYWEYKNIDDILERELSELFN
jgi:hypothetical protein